MSDYLPHSKEVQDLIQSRIDRHAEVVSDLIKPYPWLIRPCTVRVLLVTDGGLDFSEGNFGLSTFVNSLINAGLPYARFRITVAHLSDYVTDDGVMLGHRGIYNSIKGFVFDNPTYFTPTMYDQVWLFGIENYFHSGYYPVRSANPSHYHADRLADQELANLSAFQDLGGGLFATGDHGNLGKALCGSVKRAQSMRIWDHTNSDPNLDEVSMAGPRRNDTNQIGHDAGSQFDDQSDDVPQPIQPRLYGVRLSPFSARAYPHPILCGPNGVIRVLPDHPHEGETYAPKVLTNVYAYDGSEEYPTAIGYTYRVRPEVIATSTVPAGNNADGSKMPTQLHHFGAICAYDGHRAGVGRVTTDATWHHFVNINLVGDEYYPSSNPKSLGFLATPAGLAHLANIKAYYVNTAVWLCPPALQNCFRKRLFWKLLYHDRVIEAVVANPSIKLSSIQNLSLVYEIGRHASHALGQITRKCYVRRFLIDILHPVMPSLADLLDPWNPDPNLAGPVLTNWIDADPILDYALGAALLVFREANPFASEQEALRLESEPDTDILNGAYDGALIGLSSFMNDLSIFSSLAADADVEIRRFR